MNIFKTSCCSLCFLAGSVTGSFGQSYIYDFNLTVDPGVVSDGGLNTGGDGDLRTFRGGSASAVDSESNNTVYYRTATDDIFLTTETNQERGLGFAVELGDGSGLTGNTGVTVTEGETYIINITYSILENTGTDSYAGMFVGVSNSSLGSGNNVIYDLNGWTDVAEGGSSNQPPFSLGGTGTTNIVDSFENAGANITSATWTSAQFTFPNDAANNDDHIAFIAYVGNGADMAIESISLQVVPEPSVYASVVGLLVLACVGLHRRR